MYYILPHSSHSSIEPALVFWLGTSSKHRSLKSCSSSTVLLIMVSAPRPGPSTFTPSEQWLLMTATSLICGFLGYVVYDAVMATASEMLQRLLVISPLILIIAVHLLSAGSRFSIPIPGSEPGAIHRAGGSPWGVAFVLLLLVFLISYQPSLHGLIF
nr:uncharacterized protein LOC118049763 [Populus alba]